MVRFGVPGQNVNTLSYTDTRLATVPVIQAPRRPATTDKKYPMWCEWRVNKEAQAPATEGEWWKLIKFESNGDATWVQVDIGAGGAGVDQLRDQVNATASPDASGNIDIDGATVANAGNPSGIPLETVAGTNKITAQIQVATERTGAPGDTNDAGICSFDDTSFAVDADGYVTLVGGGPAVDGIVGDEGSGNVPDGSGQITITGDAVANATHAKPVYVDDTAASASTIDVQVAAGIASAPGDKNDAGLASFDSADFTVDADGFVQLAAGPSVAAGEMHNLAFTHNGTTMTLHSRDGTALSATNVGYIAMPSNATEGQIVLQAITANQTLTIADMNGATFGTDAGVAWGNNMPLYVGFIAKDDDTVPIACICRVPNAYRTPTTSTEIGDPTTPAQASTEASVFAWSNLSAYTDYDSNHVQVVGSFRATKAVTTDAWTFVTMDEQDGVNLWNDNRQFLMPYNQNGAATGSHFALNGGTTGPAFTTDNLGYTVYKDGLMDLLFNFDSCTTAGVGAVTAYIPTPYNIAGQFVGTFIAAGSTTHTNTWSLASNALSKCTIDIWLEGATAARTLAGFTTTGAGNSFNARAVCRINVGTF